MTPKKFSYLMAGLVSLLFIAIVAVVYLGDSMLKTQSEKLSSAKAQDQVIKDQEVSLAQAKTDLIKYASLNEIAKAIVPQDKDQAKTVREINAIASESGINLEQISFDTSSLGLPGAAATGSPQGAQNITQVKPVEGIQGVYSLEITVSSGSSAVPYYRFLNFLERLESNRRTAHVTSITVTPSEDDRNLVTFSLVLNAYIKP